MIRASRLLKTRVRSARSPRASPVDASSSRGIELGADDVVGPEENGWQKAVGQAGLVFDTIGGDISSGRLRSCDPAAPRSRSWRHRRTPGPQLVEIARLIDAGEIRPQAGAVFPLAQGREAFTAKSASGITGHVILQP